MSDAAHHDHGKDVEIAALKAALAARDQVIDTLCAQIAQLKRMTFGTSSEKLSHAIAQLELALEELEAESDTVIIAAPAAPSVSASSIMACWKSTIILPSAPCAASPSGAKTGCLQAPSWAANAPPRSTPSSRPANSMASNRKPISPMSSPRSRATGPLHAGTNSCRGIGNPTQNPNSHKPPNLRPPRHAYRSSNSNHSTKAKQKPSQPIPKQPKSNGKTILE